MSTARLLPLRCHLGGRSRVFVRLSEVSRSDVETHEKPQKALIFRWWAEQGSNLRPRPCKGRALPTELSARARIVADSRALVNDCRRRTPARVSLHSATPAVASTRSGSCGRPAGR